MKGASCLSFLLLLSIAWAQLPPYPLQTVVEQAISNLQASPTPVPTGLTKKDYLSTIAGIVGFFRQYQDETGRIIDPYAKAEIQYSTPTYAYASAVLSSVTGDKPTMDSGILALNISLEELVTNTCADGHTNFFTLPVMLAIETYQPYVPTSLYNYWISQATKINPNNYVNLGSNWGLVATGGEFIRYLHGLTNMSWIESRLATQIPQIDSAGMFLDPTPITNPPMPYDIFPRHYLEVMLYRGYNGTYLSTLLDLLDRGSYSSLLMQSPIGELPTGGRSSQHQWNEAVQCVIYELRASIHKKRGDMVMASAFKRAARLAHSSVKRWIRSTGDLSIVKNWFDPSLRFGYEDYSFLTNYNNLPAAMLAMAYTFADDTIPEGPSFAEVGGFVFEVPNHHKIFANVMGNYLQFETCANPEYDATGLTRVHHVGVKTLVGPTAGSPQQNGARAIGVAWKTGNVSESLAEFGTGTMTTANLTINATSPTKLDFSISYPLLSSKLGVKEVIETYTLEATNVTATTEIRGASVDSLIFIFPVFLYDGQTNYTYQLKGNSITVGAAVGAPETYAILPSSTTIAYFDYEVPSRNGYLGRASADFGNTAQGTVVLSF